MILLLTFYIVSLIGAIFVTDKMYKTRWKSLTINELDILFIVLPIANTITFLHYSYILNNNK